MITIDVVRHGLVALDVDEERARFTAVGRLTAMQPAKSAVTAESVRLLIEVQRRFGGIAPRALLGARFVPGEGDSTVFEVEFGVGAEGIKEPCPSRLWQRSFTPGLPEEFAGAVLAGLGHDDPMLPAGTVTVDRAAFDEVESSTVIFGQAAQLLGHALAAVLRPGSDLEAEVRAVVEAW